MKSAILTIFDESQRNLVSVYRKNDGEFESFGREVSLFLKDFSIVNPLTVRIPLKSAQGMGDLAAQLIKQFKIGNGADFAIAQPKATEDYYYEIGYIPSTGWNNVGRVAFAGVNRLTGAAKTFRIYQEDFAPVILRRVQFVYDKRDGEQAKWRILDVTEEDENYIAGLQDGQFKKFLKSKILGGKILPA